MSTATMLRSLSSRGCRLHAHCSSAISLACVNAPLTACLESRSVPTSSRHNSTGVGSQRRFQDGQAGASGSPTNERFFRPQRGNRQDNAQSNRPAFAQTQYAQRDQQRQRPNRNAGPRAPPDDRGFNRQGQSQSDRAAQRGDRDRETNGSAQSQSSSSNPWISGHSFRSAGASRQTIHPSRREGNPGDISQPRNEGKTRDTGNLRRSESNQPRKGQRPSMQGSEAQRSNAQQGKDGETLEAAESAVDDTAPSGEDQEEAANKRRGRTGLSKPKVFPQKESREDIEARQAAKFAESKLKASMRRLQKSIPNKDGKPRDIFLPQLITVSNLARLLGVKMRSLQNVMQSQATKDVRPDALLSFDDASMICAEYNLNAVSNDEAAFDIYPQPSPSAADRATMPFRPPVVTVMGHVDHGKTSLLDRLRSASVAAGEAGGITQHIGAFSVPVKNADSSNAVNKVTFLDTPGHAAFSNMRARGAKATDIVVLVVAADDGVMTQTKEVISLYQSLEAEAQASAADEAAEAETSTTDGTAGEAPTSSSSQSTAQKRKRNNIQLIVALSKCDRADANPQRVIEQLGGEGIYVEALGGDVPCVEISSKTGQGFEDLEETLAAMAELADLRAACSGNPEGVVLESRTEKGRGNTATVLVTRGTLATGSYLVCGQTWAKVRQMVDSNGKSVKAAKPGEAVLVSGWKVLPAAGEEVLSAKKEDEVKKAVANREANAERIRMMQEAEAINESRRLKSEADARTALLEYRERERRRAYRLATSEGRAYEDPFKDEEVLEGEESGSSVAPGAEGTEGGSDIKELCLIIKSDFSGTGEALVGSLGGITTGGARIKIVSVGVGDVSESDFALARTVGARILAFNVAVPRNIQQQVDALKASNSGSSAVDIYSSRIIYEIIEYASQSLASLLPPIIETRVLGEATVAQAFDINVKGRQFQSIAGCRVTNGVMELHKPVRVLRNKSREELEAERAAARANGDVEPDEDSRKVVFEGRMQALKHVKKDVKEMRKGTECGISFDNFQAFLPGDIVQTVEIVERPRYL